RRFFSRRDPQAPRLRTQRKFCAAVHATPFKPETQWPQAPQIGAKNGPLFLRLLRLLAATSDRQANARCAPSRLFASFAVNPDLHSSAPIHHATVRGTSWATCP